MSSVLQQFVNCLTAQDDCICTSTLINGSPPHCLARSYSSLKVPKREIFDHSDFHDFYAIKSLTVSDFGVKIKICLKNI
jgi:hypothetical protein